jgi:hypothetical protein
MNLQSWKNRIVTKLALFLLSTLTISLLPNCCADQANDAAFSPLDFLKAIVGAG